MPANSLTSWTTTSPAPEEDTAMTTTTMTPRQFCTKYDISATTELTLTNPNMDNDWQATHYKVTLKRIDPATGKRRQLTTYFSQGMAHTDPPTAHAVLSCLAMD